MVVLRHTPPARRARSSRSPPPWCSARHGCWCRRSRLAGRRSAQTAHNARLLAEAKAALIAWVAANALEAAEENPGRLPCPQAWGDVGSPNEGRAAPSCANPIGWLPWRTLGLTAMRDASGRQLWYVVSPGWHLSKSGATLTINSNTPGRLTLDGRAAVALLIAAGPALAATPNAAQLAAGCVARAQAAGTRPCRLTRATSSSATPAPHFARAWSTTPPTRCSTTTWLR